MRASMQIMRIDLSYNDLCGVAFGTIVGCNKGGIVLRCPPCFTNPTLQKLDCSRLIVSLFFQLLVFHIHVYAFSGLCCTWMTYSMRLFAAWVRI